MLNKLQLLLLGFLLSTSSLKAQQQLVTYAGNTGNESFNDLLQLSNGNYLVIGAADNLNWIPVTSLQMAWSNPGISNNQGTGKICFLLEMDPTLQQILTVCSLPAGAAEDFRFIKTANVPGQVTGNIFISGDTQDSNTGGYFIGKLNNNFLNGIPTGFTWVKNVKAATGQYPDAYQPWDVGNDGKVVYAYGDSHDYNWSAIYKTDSDGNDEVVTNWRIHWINGGGEYYGSASSYPGGINNLTYSAIVFKRDANRCELRSTSAIDYNTTTSDGNGGTKKGKWPLDVLYNGPCNPGVSGNSSSGPGYTGYSPSSTFTYGPSSICIDRRDNRMYIGFNSKSILPGGNPDFEPAVMAMDQNGTLLWWSRLYHEITPAGDTVNSTPDQYLDALAIDYSLPQQNSFLVVAARCHGNNIENLWEGNQIAANPSANGFQNTFTGTSGNIHISWLGKIKLADGTLHHSTYMAEYAEGTGSLGAAHPDPNLDGWPNPNTGWPNVNTTYIGKNRIKVTADGSVLVLGKGRRTITTANAYQKMVKPANGGLSCWNEFVRLYTPDLSKPLYSSLLVGAWDTLTQSGGDNVRLMGVWKTDSSIVVIGKHTGSGAELPLQNIPGWGNNNYNGETAILACLRANNFINSDDQAGNSTSGISDDPEKKNGIICFPNPASDNIYVRSSNSSVDQFRLSDISGRILLTLQTSSNNAIVNTSIISDGLYIIEGIDRVGRKTGSQKIIIKH
ncbi:MAG: T9SS type A sorting domain-containing protein [Bacteroidetes bacterium]|nr:T9SS type A sorting domain-containing protein [Bacteroidota bacterium]